jgi:SAM domain (Sterile alpha motif)
VELCIGFSIDLICWSKLFYACLTLLIYHVHISRSAVSKEAIYPSQGTRGFADAMGPVDNNEIDVDALEETAGSTKQEEEDEEEGEEAMPPSVPEVLEQLELPHLAEKFKQQVILTFDDLKDLSGEDLKEMELKIGERNRLKKFIAKANQPKDDPSKDPELAAIKHYASLFNSIDEDGEGGIDLAEFTGALKALGKYRNDFDTKLSLKKRMSIATARLTWMSLLHS